MGCVNFGREDENVVSYKGELGAFYDDDSWTVMTLVCS